MVKNPSVNARRQTGNSGEMGLIPGSGRPLGVGYGKGSLVGSQRVRNDWTLTHARVMKGHKEILRNDCGDGFMSVYVLKVILGSSNMRSSFKFVLCQFYPLGKQIKKIVCFLNLLNSYRFHCNTCGIPPTPPSFCPHCRPGETLLVSGSCDTSIKSKQKWLSKLYFFM